MRIPTSQHVCFPRPFCAKVLRVLRVHHTTTGPRKSLESLGIQFGVPNSQAFLSWHKWCQIWQKKRTSVTINHLLPYNSTSIYNSNFKTIDYEPSSEKNMKQLGVHVPEFKKEHYQNLPSATLNFDVITLKGLQERTTWDRVPCKHPFWKAAPRGRYLPTTAYTNRRL